MKNLLNVFTRTILPIAIIIITIIFAILIYKSLQKKFKQPIMREFKASEKPNVKLRTNYCSEDEMKFLDALHKALPRECISFPRVGVTNLIDPKNNLNDYKSIENQYVDIVVFLRKEMKPILVIDLYQSSPAAQQFKTFNNNVSIILKALKIPVMKQQIQNTYNTNELLINILKYLDTESLAVIRNKYIK